jgi:hypothetical protein
MLSVSNLEYDSPATVLFQRLSVSVTGLVLVAAMLYATRRSKDSPAGLTAFSLAVCNAGLIMVDNIHFQYNGILLGAVHNCSSCTHCYVARQHHSAASQRCRGLYMRLQQQQQQQRQQWQQPMYEEADIVSAGSRQARQKQAQDDSATPRDSTAAAIVVA